MMIDSQGQSVRVSEVWIQVYIGGIAFLNHPENRENQIALNAAIEAWKAAKSGFLGQVKRAVFGDGKARGDSWVQALQSELDAADRLYCLQQTTEADRIAFAMIEAHQLRLINKVLDGARVWYRYGLQDLGDLQGAATDTVNSWYQVAGGTSPLETAQKTVSKGSRSALTRLESAMELEPIKTLFYSLLGNIEENLKEQGFQILTEILGQTLLQELAKCIPYMGTISEGKALLSTAKSFADSSWDRLVTSRNSAAVRHGSPLAAVEGLKTLIEREMTAIGLDLASQASNFTIGIVSTVTTGSDAASNISRAVTATAKLLSLIYNFGRDWYEITLANKALVRKSIDNSIISTCPLLGAQLIVVGSVSDLIALDLSRDGVYIPATFAGKRDIERELSPKISQLKISALRMLSNSRFEVFYTPPASLIHQIDRILGASDQFRGNKGEPHIYDQGLYQIRADELAKEARLQEARAAASEGIERQLAKRQWRTLSTEAANTGREWETRRAERQREWDFRNAQREEADRLAKELIEQNEQREKQARTRLEVLRQLVRQALDTYTKQTTGFRGVFTRQSPESLAAKAKLEALTATSNLYDIQEAVAWYLNLSPIQPQGLGRPLKSPSRLRTLLSNAQNTWTTSHEQGSR
jgi:Holliday junction resolvasome RuvABC endonuclease subunit